MKYYSAMPALFLVLLFACVGNVQGQQGQHHASIYAFPGSDPHVQPWGNGDHFEFQGNQDYILLQNPDYADGLGLDIHIRTIASDWWSYISAAVVRVGHVTLELDASHFWVDGNEMVLDTKASSPAGIDVQKQGIVHANIRQLNSQQFQLHANLLDEDGGDVVRFETFQDFIRVDVYSQNGESFSSSFGLLGSFPEGIKVARDRTTILNDDAAFVEEWKVLPRDGNLFHNPKERTRQSKSVA